MRAVAILVLSWLYVASCHANVTVNVDWTKVLARTSTAATIEVDVMPWLGRTDFGGSFNAYYEAMENLNAEYVRYAPWYPNPRVVVAELTPHKCTATQPATNWNSTLMDEIVRDFMAAVCGQNAAAGECKLSVVQQLSTMPSWYARQPSCCTNLPDRVSGRMYEGGYCQDADESCLPLAGEGAWNTTNPFDAYARGGALIDPTCVQMARYMGRVVGWYTNGGFADECGHWHESGLHYNWWGLSILNENEHAIKPNDGTAYTTCYDAIAAEVAKVNPTIQPVGPEIAGTTGSSLDYLLHFLNASNHEPPKPPAVSSYHWYATADSGPDGRGSGGEKFLEAWEATVTDPNSSPMRCSAVPVATDEQQSGVQGGSFQAGDGATDGDDWCDPAKAFRGGRCPNWQEQWTAGGDPNLQHAKGVGINRGTWSWNAAAATFAYGFGTLAEMGYKFVGQDQLIGGTWPDNEPVNSPGMRSAADALLRASVLPATIGTASVTAHSMDWQTGEVNAKYWVTNLLATTVGTKEEKTIFESNVTSTNLTTDSAASDPVYALPYSKNGLRGLMIVNKKAQDLSVTIAGATGGLATVVEVATSGADAKEPGFGTPVVRQLSSTGVLELGPFGVAVITKLE